MPELAEAPPETATPVTTGTLNPELAKLFKVKVADDPAPPETKPDATPPVVPPEKEAPAAAPADAKPEVVKADPSIRLAPDFTKKPDVAAPAAPDAELAELDAAIEVAPTPKAKADLARFRGQLADLKKENATLKAHPVAAPEGQSDYKALYEDTKKQLEDASARIERTNLFESPKFINEHLAPRQKQFDRLSSMVKEAGGDSTALSRAIGMSGKGRIDALDEIRADIGSEMLKGQFDRLIEDIDARTVVINEKVHNAKATAQELQKSELLSREEQNAQQFKQFEGLLSHAERDLSENFMPELFQKVDHPDFGWWNDGIERDRKVAREALFEATPQKASYAAVLASKAGTLYDMWKAERAAATALRQEIAELRGAGPGLKAERKASTVTTEASTSESILAGLRSGSYKK